MFLENPYSDYMSMSFIVNISYSGKEQRYSEFTRIKYSFLSLHYYTHYTVYTWLRIMVSTWLLQQKDLEIQFKISD